MSATLRNNDTESIGIAPSQQICSGRPSQYRRVGTAAHRARSAASTQNPKASGMATLAWSEGAAAIPSPTTAGGTEAANRATAQIALTRMRWLVPIGGACSTTGTQPLKWPSDLRSARAASND